MPAVNGSNEVHSANNVTSTKDKDEDICTSADLHHVLVNMTTFITRLQQQEQHPQPQLMQKQQQQQQQEQLTQGHRTEWYRICDTDEEFSPSDVDHKPKKSMTSLVKDRLGSLERRKITKNRKAKLPTPMRGRSEPRISVTVPRYRAMGEGVDDSTMGLTERDKMHHKWVNFLFD